MKFQDWKILNYRVYDTKIRVIMGQFYAELINRCEELYQIFETFAAFLILWALTYFYLSPYVY